MSTSRQLALHLPLKPSYAEIDFIESPCNKEALQWIRRWPDWPVKMIAVYGMPGCGKTHLAHIWQEKSTARLLTAQDITQITPLEAAQDATSFVLDDAETLEDENWLFHFYNLVKEKDAYCLFCCRQAPTQWKTTLPDLQSRLSTIVSIPVTLPDEDALRAVLFKLFAGKGMTLSQEIAEYILRRVERSFEAVRSLVDAIDCYTLSTHRPLTLMVVREVLASLPTSHISQEQ
jgi:DnaA regulatory inactivator Hda